MQRGRGGYVATRGVWGLNVFWTTRRRAGIVELRRLGRRESPRAAADDRLSIRIATVGYRTKRSRVDGVMAGRMLPPGALRTAGTIAVGWLDADVVPPAPVAVTTTTIA